MKIIDIITESDNDPSAMDYARSWTGTQSDPYDGPVELYDWKFCDYPTRELTRDVHGDDAVDWLRQENRERWEDLGQEDYYMNLVHEEITEPVVFVFADGQAHMWDGYHRTAAQFWKEAPTIKACVGTPNEQWHARWGR